MNHSINNNTLKSKKNKYLILIDRYKIEGLKKKGISNKDIGDQIGNDHELAKYIEDKIINGKQSPDVVIGRIKVEGLKFKSSICTKTLYNYIDKGIFLNLTNKHLLIERKGYKRKYKKVSRIALNNIKGRSIEERAEDVNERKLLGHWEMDCVVSGRGSKGVLLVLTERCSRRTMIFIL